MFVKRNKKKLKTDARILVAAVQEMQAALSTEKSAEKNKQQRSRSIFRNTGLVHFSRHKKRHLRKFLSYFKRCRPTCFYCHKKEHLQKIAERNSKMRKLLRRIREVRSSV